MAETIYERSDPRTAKEYYASLQGAHGTLESKFKNIDDKANFVDYMQRLKNPLTRSFVLDFGNEDAFCATDLNSGDFRGLLTGQVGWMLGDGNLVDGMVANREFCFRVEGKVFWD
jgi:hypothetical protein